MCTGTCVRMCMCACEGSELMLEVFLDGFPLDLLKQGPSVKLEFTNPSYTSWPACHRIPSRLPACWDYRRLQYLPSFYVCSRDLNSTSHVCAASVYSLGHPPALKPLFLNTDEEIITIFLELPITRCCSKQVSFILWTRSALRYCNDSKHI